MVVSKLFFLLFNLVFLWCFIEVHSNVFEDFPCAARYMQSNRSVVCVCNATYCDTITRVEPVVGTYVAYTTSNAGLRFHKTYGQFHEGYQPCGSKVYVLNPIKLYQTIIGFGGAVTDSAGVNWRSLSTPAQKKMINTYFSKHGSEYNIIRTPVGASDFSMRVYAYNEYPVNDTSLSNFTLVPEDHQLKIPMIRAAMEVATSPIMTFGTTWSPAPWMKSNNAFTDQSRLIAEYYQVYADYHCLFAQRYADAGINLWGFTTGNEPLDGVFPFVRFQTLGFNSSGMGVFIEQNFGPTLKNKCPIKNLGIMAVDDQVISVPLFFNLALESSPDLVKYVDGIAFHWYADTVTPPTVISDIIKEFPNKFALMTEACAGFKPSDIPKVDLGSWDRANSYITNILQNLRNTVGGWVDWNLALDLEGGPNWSANYVDATVIVNAEKDEFYKQPTFYALAHFSKFLPPGSRRLKVIETTVGKAINEYYYYDSEDIKEEYDNVAFLTPRNTIVYIVHNTGNSKTITIQIGEQQIIITLEAESVTTIEFPYDSSSLCNDLTGAHAMQDRPCTYQAK